MTYTIETVEDLEKLPIKISYVGEMKRGEWECFARRMGVLRAACGDILEGRGLVYRFFHWKRLGDQVEAI